MARALRPVVILMLLAALLFIVAGVLDGGLIAGEPGWTAEPPLAWASYLFAAINLGFAAVIARGSERSLVGRIGLSLFFVVERTVSAFALGPKSPISVGVHLATALVELAIFIGAYRVWRLGRSFGAGDLDALFAVDGAASPAERSTPPAADDPPGPTGTVPPAPPGSPAPPPDPATPGSAAGPGAATGPGASTGSGAATGSAISTGPTAAAGSAWSISAEAAWRTGLLSLALAVLLVADGLRLGFVPGGTDWGLSGAASGWRVYLFAVVVLAVAARAVQGGALALRLLLAMALLLFVERGLSPLAIRLLDPISLALHAIAAFVGLALALDAASAIRRAGHAGGHAATSAA